MPLSSKQMEYLALAWQCFESEPKIDYEKFKSVAGLASAHSARELMRVTKKKLKEEYGSMSSGMKDSNAGTVDGKNGSGTPKTPTSRKRAAPSSSATPASSRKSAKTSAQKAATPVRSEVAEAEAEDEEEEEHQTPVPKKGKKSASGSEKRDSASPVKKEGVEGDGGEEGEFFF